MAIAVFLPVDPHLGIDRGSGIVGTREGDRLMIDFEGNRYGAQNLTRYVERVHHAWDRHETHYPTIARMWVDQRSMRQVAYYHPYQGLIRILSDLDHDLLQDWIGRPLTEAEIVLTP